MKKIYKDELFRKKILVSEGENDINPFEVLYSMAALFNIKIVKGQLLANESMLRYISGELAIKVPEPFYKGFPESVRKLSKEELLFDQFFHYLSSYGLGNFDEAGYSMFEELTERTAFKENTEIRDFSIVGEAEAEKLMGEIIENLLCSSRPLSIQQFSLVLEYVNDYNYKPKHCASKNTAIKLLNESRNLSFADFLMLSDVIKLLDEINFENYGNTNLKKLNLRNQDRKFITAVIDRIFDENRCDARCCCEKKAIWSGLLHHIHYKPKTKRAEDFTALIRGRKNISVYSEFEKAMAERNIKKAVETLKEGKSSAALLRNLNYILSRCNNAEELDYVISQISSDNLIVLIQLLFQYAGYTGDYVPRDFKFTRYNTLCVHHESEDEFEKRKSLISPKQAERVSECLRENIKDLLKGRIQKLYIDREMKKIALPLQENTSQGGLGVMSKGSRLPIPEGKKIRAFTYWEKVDDIDLSVIGLDDWGGQTEFSWRNMYGRQSSEIRYSGDQTCGYNGGSEYFDVDIKKFKKKYSGIKYLIFCDNVYSGINFDECFCKAGYMLRDAKNSGQVYEPKTVESSYLIDCPSTFAYLFGIDLQTNEFVWLNCARQGRTIVAGESNLNFLRQYFDTVSVLNLYSFFEMMAEQICDDPAEADVIVSDKFIDVPEDKKVIRSYDFDKILAYMNMEG